MEHMFRITDLETDETFIIVGATVRDAAAKAWWLLRGLASPTPDRDEFMLGCGCALVLYSHDLTGKPAGISGYHIEYSSE